MGPAARQDPCKEIRLLASVPTIPQDSLATLLALTWVPGVSTEAQLHPRPQQHRMRPGQGSTYSTAVSAPEGVCLEDPAPQPQLCLEGLWRFGLLLGDTWAALRLCSHGTPLSLCAAPPLYTAQVA